MTPGPTMFEWCRSHGAGLDRPGARRRGGCPGSDGLPDPTAGERVLRVRARPEPAAGARARWSIITHAQRAVDLCPAPHGEREVVVLEDGRDRLTADAVVLMNSHVDVRPAPAFAALAAFADDHGLTYLPPGYGGDLDLDLVEAGQDVIVRGFGLGLHRPDDLAHRGPGRRGSWHDDAGLRYQRPRAPSRTCSWGRGAGVPYHGKPMYRLQSAKPTATSSAPRGRDRAGRPRDADRLLRRPVAVDRPRGRPGRTTLELGWVIRAGSRWLVGVRRDVRRLDWGSPAYEAVDRLGRARSRRPVRPAGPGPSAPGASGADRDRVSPGCSATTSARPGPSQRRRVQRRSRGLPRPAGRACP